MDKNAYKRMMEHTVPGEALIQTTKRKMSASVFVRATGKIIKEEPIIIKRSFSAAAVAALTVLLFATTAFAAWHFLKPADVTGKFDDNALSADFESAGAVNINESVISGDYNFTLLAIVSGQDISDHAAYSNGDIRSDRTYAVLAIQKADGSPMPPTHSDEYRNLSFYVSPYIKGQKPWEVNARTLNSSYSETVVDGVMYRLLDCDEITMFADRGVYLGVNTGSVSDHAEAFIYNGQTGELQAKPDYHGSSAVFELPIDKSLADPEKAKAYLDALCAADEAWSAASAESGASDDLPAETGGTAHF